MTQARLRSLHRGIGLLAVAFILMLVGASRASADVDIQSSGPLTDITIGDDLRCQVVADGNQQFFGGAPGSCGWSVVAGGQVYGYASGGWQSDSPASLSGTGTAQDPYKVTTVVEATNGSTPIGLQATEVDTYVVGNDFYQTDLTLHNTNGPGGTTFTGLKVYRVADCTLEANDDSYGFIDPTSGTAACAQNANNSPGGPVEAFVPITRGNHFEEGNYSHVDFSVPTSQQDYSDSCECTTLDDSGMGLNWSPADLGPGQSTTVSLRYDFSSSGVLTLPISASGGNSLSGTAGSPVSGTVATISDPNSGDTPGNLSATINWGDGTSSGGTISGGNGSFTVSGSHTYASAGSYTITVTVTRGGSTAVATDSALITSKPGAGAAGTSTVGITAAGFTGSVNPGGLPTTASFEYGLDPKYTGGGPVDYNQSTAPQPVGSDFSSHLVSASVAGLVPNALYHVRLVTSNSAGTTFGPDTTFTTKPAPPPANPPVLGQTFNVKPVSGVVLILINGQFVPLTQLKQIPQNVVINALHGTIQLVSASAGPGQAHDAAAKGKKHKKAKTKTQSGTFGGAVFKVKQARGGPNKGLTTLTLVEGKVKGAPSFGICKRHKAGEATAAALSSRTLALLKAKAKGKFSTSGRYGAATVRGTSWTIADRCDGTLIRDITHSVAVSDFVRHKTIVLHAGQHYLAKARK